MARADKSAMQFAGADAPATRRDSSFLDRRKEVIVAKSVVDEVRKRVLQFRGGESKAERDIEKEKEEKMEKARAAAWAWYQHGKGGKESISSGGGPVGSISTLSVRAGEPGHKSSRFKTEALRTSGLPVTPPAESDRSWEFSTFSANRTSSLFDSYELDSVSRRLDIAFHGEGSSAPTPMLPAPMRPPGAYVPKVSTAVSVPKVTTVSAPKMITQKGASSATKVTRSCSLRVQFPRSLCRSISDVVSREEMALGVDIGKCDCQKNRVGRSGNGGWSLRRLSRAIQVFMHLPDCEYHPQQQHHERRHERRNARLHHHEHHHHHQHEHEFHHHVHYQVKLRDGVHHGNSFTACPGKSDPFTEVPKEKDHLLFPRLSPKMSPKVSPKLSSQ